MNLRSYQTRHEPGSKNFKLKLRRTDKPDAKPRHQPNLASRPGDLMGSTSGGLAGSKRQVVWRERKGPWFWFWFCVPGPGSGA
ncbi:hypothetical protein VTL71DRAFT_10979, partial [Oculimacula yallundae]